MIILIKSVVNASKIFIIIIEEEYINFESKINFNY